MRLLLACLTLALAFSAGAAPKKHSPARKPNQASASQMSFKVTYGEKVTVFVISKKEAGGQIDFVNNSGSRGVRDLNAVNYEYLKNQIAQYKGPSNSRSFCPRNNIEMTAGSKVLIGCMGARNKLARSMQETTNLISLMF